MADKKITDLTELTIPEDNDEIVIVDDPSGTPITKKIKKTNFAIGLDGWTSITDTFTYLSTTTITVASGAGSKYSVGDKLRFQNNDSGTYLYAYVVSIADTVLTVMGDTVPNATLTDSYYSKIAKLPFIGAQAKPSIVQENLVSTLQTQIVLGTENFDEGNNFASNQFTAPADGKYRISFQISFLGSSVVANKTYVGRIYKNGSGGSRLMDITNHSSYTAADSTARVDCNGTKVVSLSAGDTIQLWARQNSGVNTVDINSTYTFLEVILLNLA